MGCPVETNLVQAGFRRSREKHLARLLSGSGVFESKGIIGSAADVLTEDDYVFQNLRKIDFHLAGIRSVKGDDVALGK